MAYVAPNRPESKSITYIQTDGQTDKPTNGRTRSYQAALLTKKYQGVQKVMLNAVLAENFETWLKLQKTLLTYAFERSSSVVAFIYACS